MDLTPHIALLNDKRILAAAGALLLLALIALPLRSRTAWLRRIQPKTLLTPNEAEFFHRLQRALPTYEIFPQVAFAAFLTDDGRLSAQRRWSVRAKFDRKIADYVICERGTLKIIALIELDDRTHSSAADRQRDAITKAARYKTFRFQSRQKPSVAELAALFQHAQAWTAN
jgi:hypothetical protein